MHQQSDKKKKKKTKKGENVSSKAAAAKGVTLKRKTKNDRQLSKVSTTSERRESRVESRERDANIHIVLVVVVFFFFDRFTPAVNTSQ